MQREFSCARSGLPPFTGETIPSPAERRERHSWLAPQGYAPRKSPGRALGRRQSRREFGNQDGETQSIAGPPPSYRFPPGTTQNSETQNSKSKRPRRWNKEDTVHADSAIIRRSWIEGTASRKNDPSVNETDVRDLAGTAADKHLFTAR